jgi:hypothetical protein
MTDMWRSTSATMRCCSASGGKGKGMPCIRVRLTFC